MSGHGPRPTWRELGTGVIGLVVVIAVAIFYRGLTKDGGSAAEAAPLFALGFLSIVGVVAGQAAAMVNLPRLTGYLLAGIVVGPQVAGFITKGDVKALGLVNALALALIGLQAGAEVTLSILGRIWKSLSIAAACQLIGTIGLSAGVFWALSSHLPFLEGLTPTAVVAMALLWGVFAFTRSPAVTLAVLAETRAKGPLSEWAMGLVVVFDVLVLPIFTGAVTFARGEIEGLPFDPGVFLELTHELWESILAGIAGGLLLGFVLRIASGASRVLIVVVVGYLVTAACAYLRYDTLFVFVVMGFVAVNIVGTGNALLSAAERTSGAVFVVFFALAGAKLDLEALRVLWPVAIALAVARAVGTFGAGQIAHRLAGDPPGVRRYGWLALVSQAGVTIGLASLVGDMLPGVGRGLATLVIAVVGIHELIGPVVFKLGLGRAGELPADDDSHAPDPHAPPAAH
ncbi:MAG TPA: hypothetical protein VGF99_06070 [Myxococcota bacterium]